MNLIRRRNRFDPATFRMLARCYENTRLDDVLAVWTQMAIIGEKKEEKYFSLYQAAVARDLKITGLYEYYMETMGEVRIEQMPQVIRRFFVMNESLDWRKKARIYRNMSDSADSIPQIFAAMRPSVEKFITDQIQMLRINEDLAILISRYLNRQMITASLAKKLIRLLFTFEIDCRNPLMKKVAVADTRLSRVRTVPITGHKAQIEIYSEQSRILLEDEEGHRYASTSLYLAKHLLDDARLLNLCVQETRDDPHLVLFFTLNPKVQQPITHQTLGFFLDAERQAGISEDYRMQLRTWLLDYYDTHTSEETMGTFLRGIDTDTYVRIDRRKLLALLAQEGMYETAWPVIEKYGTEGTDLNLQVRILSQTVLDRDYEEDRTLLKFCAALFESGKVEEHLLSYLLMYYDGPVRKMKEHKLLSIGKSEGDSNNKDIYLLAVALGLDHPGEKMSNIDSYTRVTNFRPQDRSLITSVLLGTADEDSDISSYCGLKNAFDYCKQFTDAGFRAIDRFAAEANYDPDLMVRKMLDHVDSIYDDVIEEE